MTFGSISTRERLVNDRRVTRRLIALLVIGVILGERIAIPLGATQQVPLVIPFAIAVLVVGVHRQVLEISPARVRLYAFTMTILTAMTLCGAAIGRAFSMFSVVLLLAIYVMTVVRVRRFDASDASWLHQFVVRVMTGIAVVTLTQFAIQLLGIRWQDWLQKVIPVRFLLTGYNTGNPIYYGSSIYRPNGILFLEPSFVSVFLGIAIVMAISLRLDGTRIGALPILLMVAAMVTTVAGNGFIVVLAGLAIVASQQKRRAVPLLLATGAIIVATLLTPLGHVILGRSTELSNTSGTSSSNERLVAPYQILLPSFLRNPSTILVGQGPGASTKIIASDSRGVGVLAATVPKLLVEYGVVGAVAFLIFAGVFLAPGFRRYAFALGLGINFFIVNAGLLQAVLALSTFILLGLAVGHADAADPTLPNQFRQDALSNI
jgi:hypothetical protein